MSQTKQQMQLHREALQRRSQQDWSNREYIQLVTGSITRISDFLNTFSQSCSGRLANLDSRLSGLERKVIFLLLVFCYPASDRACREDSI